MAYIGVILVILLATTSFSYMIYDMIKRFNKQNEYCVDFSKGFDKKGMPMIPMTINNEIKYLLLDSGSNCNFLTQNYFDSLNIKEESDIHEIHTGSGINQSKLFKTNIKYNKLAFNDTTFYIMDIPAMRESIDYGCDIIGILGSPFFNKYKWKIDFEELVVWINR